ncbi:LCP family protein [Spongiactinospora sp. 9N601]|uniref:LCP family glycopolymer transferase n=1 Tax=Spongiactinospora sp. 9N601 TaxID=3375149 RepID=UPI0037AE0EE0
MDDLTDDLTMLRYLGRELEHEPPATLVRQRARLAENAATRPRWGVRKWMLVGVAALITAAVALTPTLLIGDRAGRPVAAPPDPRPAKLTEALSVLLVGTDSEMGTPRYRLPGARSDTMLLLHLPADGKRPTVVSIPRDSMVRLPACAIPKGADPSLPNMINSAFHNGGLSCAWRTVESLTRIRIDHAVQVEFTGFAEIIDALGGIEVTIPAPIDDRQAKLTLSKGRQLLDGKAALGYARLRRFGDGSDLARIGRQQQVMRAMLKKVRATTPAELLGLLDTLKQSVTTDSGLDTRTLAAIAGTLAGTDPGSIRFVTVPTMPHPGDPNRLAWREKAAEQLFAAIREHQAE